MSSVKRKQWNQTS